MPFRNMRRFGTKWWLVILHLLSIVYHQTLFGQFTSLNMFHHYYYFAAAFYSFGFLLLLQCLVPLYCKILECVMFHLLAVGFSPLFSVLCVHLPCVWVRVCRVESGWVWVGECVFIMKTNLNTPLHMRTHVYLHVKVANVSQKE